MVPAHHHMPDWGAESVEKEKRRSRAPVSSQVAMQFSARRDASDERKMPASSLPGRKRLSEMRS
jgi:hypothetical protein